MIGVVAALLIFVAGVVLNGLFAGYETGFVSADPIRMQHLSEEAGDPRARHILRHRNNPDNMLTTLLVGTNLALIAGTMALTFTVEYAWLSTLIATPIFLVFSEVMPKSIFRRHPVRYSLAFFTVIRGSQWVLAPLVYPTTLCIRFLRVVFRASSDDLNPVMSTEQDFRNLVDESAAQGSIEPEEREMIHSIMDLQSRSAKEIMVPRIDIEALPDTATREELIHLFETSGRSRVPIYKESIDTIIGVANVYDVLTDAQPERNDISRFAKQVVHVPDTAPVADLLQQLKRSQLHMAIVMDEYGGTDGLVTLEDVLEEIFGEIEDEHDTTPDMIQQVGPHAYVVDARMPLEDLAEALSASIVDEEVETVGGWVMHGAGRIPGQGEKLRHDGFRVTILDGGVSKISKVRLDLLPERRTVSHEEP